MRLLNVYMLFFCFVFFTIVSKGQAVMLFEDFESGSLPSGWTEIKVKGKVGQGDAIVNWVYQNGGFQGHPESAYSGSKNALFYFQSPNGESTKLVTKPFDLLNKQKPELRFYHAQVDFYPNPNDFLRVFFKSGPDSSWVLLGEYLELTPTWTQRVLLLPETGVTDSCYIAFEGTTRWGFGVCIDSVIVLETELADRVVSNVSVTQASTGYIPSGLSNAPIIRIGLQVQGNSGTLTLDSLVVTSLNSKDHYVKPNGVKLFYTTSPIFSSETQIGTAQSFVGGKAYFTGIAKSLPTGMSYVWVTYDIVEGHDTIHGQIADAMIEAYSIKAGTGLYPLSNLSPEGNRIIYESLFFDDFETDKGWTMPTVDTNNNEFQIASPMGLGGVYGNPDPIFAFSETKVLGTDLTGLGTYPGDFEKGIGVKSYQAISPSINCSYYNDLKLSYQRYLNSGFNDFVYIDISNDNGATWNNIYANNSYLTDNTWSLHSLDINSFARNKSQVKIRYSLGATQIDRTFSGWNIDDFVITGDYITRDLGVSRFLSPVDGCGHTSADTVKVVIRNYGALNYTGIIPVKYFFGGPANVHVTDTFNGTIAQGDSVVFTFKQTVDLSVPYFYTAGELYACTDLADDEDKSMDTAYYNLKVRPTYTLPYTENFEDGNGFWFEALNVNSHQWNWKYGNPANDSKYILISAPSGEKAWYTSAAEYYVFDTAALESPCFDFSAFKHPVFEFSYASYAEDSIDGAALFFSADQGQSWHYCDTHNYSFRWDWYNYDSLRAIHRAGWGGYEYPYKRVKQLLPAGVSRKSDVRLRFYFFSDSAYFYDGFIFDDIRMYEAPNDIGVEKVLSPVSDCELSPHEKIKVSVKNFGIDTMFIGYKFKIAYKVNSSSWSVDTVTVKRNIPVNDTMQYTFKTPYDMYQSGVYNIVAATESFEYDNIYSDTAYVNDTAKATVLVRKPYVELGNNIYTVHPDTVVLDASAGSDIVYYWAKVGKTDTLSVNPVFAIPDSGWYKVVLTDTITHCVANDTILIMKLVADVGVSELLSPVSDCELGDTVAVKVRITNFGTDTIRGNYMIYAFCDVGIIVSDTIAVADTIYPDSSFVHTFKKRIDMSVVQPYHFSCFTKYVDDTTKGNDITKTTVHVWGYPAFSLIPEDTIHIGFSFRLNAARGDTTFKQFKWHDGSTDSTFLVTAKGTGYYAATVTDVHGCTSSDTSKVRLVYQDIQVVAFSLPGNHCGPMTDGRVEVIVKNTGTDTLISGSNVPVYYYVDTLSPVGDTIVLSAALFPGDSISYRFTDTLKMLIIGQHSITSYTALARDSVPTNDSAAKIITVFDLPSVNLGNDTVVNDVPQYIVDAGSFASYVWHDNSTDSIFIVNGDNGFPYIFCHVTVTDANGCQASDVIKVDLNFTDIQVARIVFPDSLCLVDSMQVTAIIKNRGTNILSFGTIQMAYRVDTDTAKTKQNLNISSDIYPKDSLVFVFTKPFSKEGVGNFGLTVTAMLTGDIVSSNDTFIDIFYLYGPPHISFKDAIQDTVLTSFPYSIQLNETFVSYAWSTGATTASVFIAKEQWYAVTVTDAKTCVGTDSVFIQSNGMMEIAGSGKYIRVCPVPASDRIIMECVSPGENTISIELIATNGRRMYNNTMWFSDRTICTIDVSSYPEAMYYLKITNKEETIIKKIVLQR